MCTRIFNFNRDNYAITGKNTDWFYPMDCRVYINPEQVYKQGMSESLAKHCQVDSNDILVWEAKYQSICYYIYGQLPKIVSYNETELCAMDGMNSAGLAVSVLADANSSFKGVEQPGKNKIATIRFSQYLLDCFSSVNEAIAHINKVQPFLFDPGVPKKSARNAWFHFTLSDQTGDSAIIEFKAGIAHIYHSPDYVIATNQPSYDVQLDLLKYWQYQWQPAADKDEPKLTSTPGGTSSAQRFERASYYHNFVQPVVCSEDAVAQTKGMLSTVITPMQFSKSGQQKERYTYTIWSTLCDQINLRYYFQPNQTMNSMFLAMPKQTKRYAQFVQVAKEQENNYWLNNSAGDISAQLERAKFIPFTISKQSSN